MKKRPLTYVGAFLFLIVALWVAMGNFKPETKQQPLIQTSEVKPKPRLSVAKKAEIKQQSVAEEFTIKTRVSMANPNQQ